MQSIHSVCLCLFSDIEERFQILIVLPKVEVYSGMDLVS